MKTSALITMLVAWGYMTFFMLRFLIKVIRTPQEKDDTKPEE